MSNPWFRPLFWPTLFTLLALPVLTGLSLWQVERLEWKEGLLTKIAERMDAEAVPLPATAGWADYDARDMEYTRVAVEGRFLPVEFHYFTQGERGAPGYAVISPLELADGALVFVDRGFVPVALKDAALRGGIPQGGQRFTGVIRAPSERGAFDGADDPQKNVWMVRDPTIMGAGLGDARIAPFIVEAEEGAFPGEWPKAGRTRIDIPNNHLDYALTWGGLALVLIVIYVLYHRANGRIGRQA
ncbi:MAG: SURF1 family protein [Alphaproteobacteria bacterium]|nr:SURF1 family protein [Alphaproteobacteria bacterium]MDX5415653.1 SURF1 family protein [Alphaproteobacteria bacterium]MDX5492913.1 SURF1 family protein [Alphaproteobacteria bacterium]